MTSMNLWRWLPIHWFRRRRFDNTSPTLTSTPWMRRRGACALEVLKALLGPLITSTMTHKGEVLYPMTTILVQRNLMEEGARTGLGGTFCAMRSPHRLQLSRCGARDAWRRARLVALFAWRIGRVLLGGRHKTRRTSLPYLTRQIFLVETSVYHETI